MAEAPFKLRSGNTTPFKQMGSTPVKQETDWEAMHQTAKDKYNRYDDLTTEEYKAEALRQSEKKKETGDYDVSGVYDHKGNKTEKVIKNYKEKNKKKDEKKDKKKKGNFFSRTLKRFDDAVQSRMKNPRKDWDKEGYESERKQQYKDYDEKNRKKSGGPTVITMDNKREDKNK